MDDHGAGTSRSFHLDRVIVVSVLLAAAAPVLVGATYPVQGIIACGQWLYGMSAAAWVVLVLGSALVASGIAALIVGLRQTPRVGLATTLEIVIVVGISATIGLVLGRALGGCPTAIDWAGSAFLISIILSLVGGASGLLIGLGIGVVRHRRGNPHP
jgi:hypothetical protein